VIFRRPPRDGRRFLSRAVQSRRESTSSVRAHHNGFTKRLSCHISQEVCPFPTRFAESAREPGYAARGPGERPVGVEAVADEDVSCETSSTPSDRPLHPGTDAPSLVALLGMALDPKAWEAFSRGSAIRRAGRAGFARNVCVALGNWGSPEAVPVLARALADPDPLVRGHAAWALGRVGGAEAREVLSGAAPSEENAWVSAELEDATAKAG
jgi:epoxyqueuosine reductase QueG